MRVANVQFNVGSLPLDQSDPQKQKNVTERGFVAGQIIQQHRIMTGFLCDTSHFPQ